MHGDACDDARRRQRRSIATAVAKHRRRTSVVVLFAIKLSQEIGVLPIHNLYLGLLCRVDVELVEDHHRLVSQIVERPYCLVARTIYIIKPMHINRE